MKKKGLGVQRAYAVADGAISDGDGVELIDRRHVASLVSTLHAIASKHTRTQESQKSTV